MIVLPDISIWVEYLRRGTQGSGRALDDLLSTNRVVACGPVMAELLTGTAVSTRDTLRVLFEGLPWADIDRAGWALVGETAARLRDSGATVPLTDIVIAVSAVGANAMLWTADADFRRIEAVLPSMQRYSP